MFVAGANQAGMTGFGMPRREITHYKVRVVLARDSKIWREIQKFKSLQDEVRGEMPHDESSVSRQTSGWKEGENPLSITVTQCSWQEPTRLA